MQPVSFFLFFVGEDTRASACNACVQTERSFRLWTVISEAVKAPSTTPSTVLAMGHKLENTDWMLSTPCGVHDAHNALNWGLSSITEGTTLEDLHIVIEAFRNTFAALRAHIPQFLQQKLRFHHLPQPATDASRMLWALLGVEPGWIEVVVSLSPTWSEGWLYVNETDQPNESPVDHISHLFFHLMRWRQFTQSRWATTGPSCRALAASLLLGLDELVHPHVSEFHIGGFYKLSLRVLEFTITAAAASYPMESFILSLLHDDRPLRGLPVLEAELEEETHYLETLSVSVWERLAKLHPELSAPWLQSTALNAAHTSSPTCRTRPSIRPGSCLGLFASATLTTTCMS